MFARRSIDDRDVAIREREATVAEREATIVGLHDLIRLREAELAQRDEVICEREAAIEDRDGVIHQREAALAEIDGLLRRREEEVEARDEIVREREAAIADLDDLVKRREQDAVDRGELIREREATIAQLNGLLGQREAGLHERAALLLQREATIERLEQGIRRLEAGGRDEGAEAQSDATTWLVPSRFGQEEGGVGAKLSLIPQTAAVEGHRNGEIDASGALQASSLRLVSADEYFASHDAKVAACLGRFPGLLRAMDADPTSGAAERALVVLGSEITVMALGVCGLSDAMDVDGEFDRFKAMIERCIEVFAASSQSFLVSASRDLETHAVYCSSQLAAREGDHLSAGRCRRDFLVNAVVVLTNHIFNAFKWVGKDPRAATHFFDPGPALRATPGASRAIIEASKGALQGWCSTPKAMLLYSLVRAHRPNAIVEIGIYGGRSIVPMAVAARDNGRGYVAGIETWSADGAKQYRTNIGNDFWWTTVDFTRLKRDFHAFLAAHDLDAIVKVIEAPSDRAHYLFDEIDMLHIDGGHSTFGAAQDVVNYVAKVRRGGVIVYDDINWPTTAAGLQILMDTCQLVDVVEVMDSPGLPGCAAFVKI